MVSLNWCITIYVFWQHLCNVMQSKRKVIESRNIKHITHFRGVRRESLLHGKCSKISNTFNIKMHLLLKTRDKSKTPTSTSKNRHQSAPSSHIPVCFQIFTAKFRNQAMLFHETLFQIFETISVLRDYFA